PASIIFAPPGDPESISTAAEIKPTNNAALGFRITYAAMIEPISHRPKITSNPNGARPNGVNTLRIPYPNREKAIYNTPATTLMIDNITISFSFQFLII